MNKKLEQTIKKIIIATIVISLVISTLVSINVHHLEVCEKEDCDVCALIELAQAIITIIFYTFASLLSSFLIYIFSSELIKIENIKKQRSLVSQKVQQNE